MMRTLPARALALSAAALAVPILGIVFFSESLDRYSVLLWTLALVPAFLLAYYRSWPWVSLALAAGMALLIAGYLVAIVRGFEAPDWPFLVFVVSAYIAIALGAGWIGELRESAAARQTTRQELERAYEALQRSHAELQAAQLQLIQAEKLESVGRLAAGVAHEVKNPLMTLLAGIQYLQKQGLATNADVEGLLVDMSTAVKRADFVIRELLNFSSPHPLDMKANDLNDVVERTLGLVKHEVDRVRITVVRELGEGLPPVTFDAYRIQQVFLNLIMNAAQAMDGSGTLTVRTRLTSASALGTAAGNRATGAVMSNLDAVLIEVDDTGPGIPADKLPKIYDPFFTTKPTGQGTGLGLSVALQIVEMHGGKLSIVNRAEGGVRATVLLRLQPEQDTHGDDREETRPAR
ncbi:MAG: hypothetical protein HY701_01985 [Gemmatimonadetes bacterium]|nr:hypothetical protein [Gemmatimonadota bacterium]